LNPGKAEYRTPAIIAGIETFIVTKEIANSPPTRNPRCLAQDALPSMPCPRRPGCLDSISSFDSAGVVHNNVYSTEIVQAGSKIA
jgi:hypothetical protein